ncbi:methyltransferase-like protein 24 [Pecten maximus]|uniref:methyltransferase-like protein 24 n=1 Tax=Pecten maximus TaxID=6579 RepID=UPI0014587370|nr:methyltransferase-like protein 24 [Pecten maximus]
MMRRTIKPILLLILVVAVLTFIIRLKKTSQERISSRPVAFQERIFSRPKWDFNIKNICGDQLATSGQQEVVIMEHQLPIKTDLCPLSVPEIERTYAWYFNNIQSICGNLKRFGRVKDGGWDVCLDEDLVQKGHCLVYSFGIDFEFSFDDGISEEWGCMVHSFDPSMNTDSHRRSPKVYFHNLGLSNFNGTTPEANWKMLTFQGIRQELNHQNIIPDIIKMDIEDWEWHVIPEMLTSKALTGVKQFLVEFHFSNIPEADTEGFWISKFFLLKELYAMGFRMTWITRNLLNVWQSRVTGKDIIGCFEVTFIRR